MMHDVVASETLDEDFGVLEADLPFIDDLPIDDRFDIVLAEYLAKVESYNKHLYRPNTYLHKWWARRCGTTFRAILKHLVCNPAKQNYYTAGGLEGQIILDPMMGGGTTLHEAIRLGANVVGADIDPIPILQVRSTLTEVPLKDLIHQFNHFYESLCSKLGYFYRVACPVCGEDHELRFVLYGLRLKCLNGHESIVVDSYILRQNSDGSEIHVCPETYNILQDREIHSSASIHPSLPLLEKKNKRCFCGEKFENSISDPYYKRYVPIAIAGECSEHGVFFNSPGKADIDRISSADAKRGTLKFDPDHFKIHPGPKSSDLVKRGILSYLDLYSSRQLLFFNSAINELQKLDDSIRLKFSLLLSTSTEFNSMLCGYKGAGKNRPGAIRHTFAHHAYSFPYTALENNPLYSRKSSGTLQNLFHNRLIRGYRWAMKPLERKVLDGKPFKVHIHGERDSGTEYFSMDDLKEGTRRFLLLQGSSGKLPLPDGCIDHVVTDPPYFDSVQYSDLAAYFRVWLRQMLPDEVLWDYSTADSAVDPHSNGSDQYEMVLSRIFSECHRVLKEEKGRMIFTFHHWNPKGWAALTIALKRAGFVLMNRYVIHSENLTSVHISNQKALVHDVVLVFAKKGSGFCPDWEKADRISKEESFAFCEQCGTLLGCLLNENDEDQKIHRIWSESIL